MNKKEIKILLFLVVLQLGVFNSKALEKEDVNYNVTYETSTPKIVQVELAYVAKNDTLYMGQGADQFPNRWAKFINILEIRVDNVVHSEYKLLENADWVIKNSKGKAVKIVYEVKLEHEEFDWDSGIDGAIYKTTEGLFFTGRSIFIVPSGEFHNYNIEFIIPKPWEISVPWEVSFNRPNTFKVSIVEQLIDSIGMLGIYDEIEFERDNFKLVLNIDNELEQQKEGFTKLSQGVLDYYISLMGGIPNPTPTQQFKKVLVIVNKHQKTDGEVIGNHISITLDPSGNEMSQMVAKFIFAHEFFHLWNGKSFRPENQKMEWFKEGFTNFYTLKALSNIGQLNQDTYFKILDNLFYQRYINDEGLGNIPLTSGEAKHSHWGLIYGGGLFVAIVQDIMIREASNNKKSLDDIFRKLYIKHGGTNKTYSLSYLKKQFTDLSNMDQSSFFEKYIDGTDIIPVEFYYKKLGLDANVLENHLKVKNNGLDPNKEEILNSTMGLGN